MPADPFEDYLASLSNGYDHGAVAAIWNAAVDAAGRACGDVAGEWRDAGARAFAVHRYGHESLGSVVANECTRAVAALKAKPEGADAG